MFTQVYAHYYAACASTTRPIHNSVIIIIQQRLFARRLFIITVASSRTPLNPLSHSRTHTHNREGETTTVHHFLYPIYVHTPYPDYRTSIHNCIWYHTNSIVNSSPHNLLAIGIVAPIRDCTNNNLPIVPQNALTQLYQMVHGTT